MPAAPPTLARFVASLPTMVYAQKGNTLYVNLYTDSKSTLNLNGQEIEIIQNTQYPWDGDVIIEVNSTSPFNGQIMLRIPSWVNNSPVWGNLYNYLPQNISPVSIKLNGEIQNVQPDETGYVILSPKENRSKITIHFPMEIRQVVALDSISHLKGKVALQRGPMLYCFEQQDNNQDLSSLTIKNTGSLETQDKTFSFGETRVITNGEATAIPYFLWSNRGENKMKFGSGKNNKLPYKKIMRLMSILTISACLLASCESGKEEGLHCHVLF
ncbi:MAG: glycoside hydrolase family 127 protein [Bacteroidales bacterium]|nr:glycoside hydrolase family 127 protein [Bacteroidales bacterium]